MNKSVYVKRLDAVRSLMKQNNIDVFLVSPGANLFYLSGYHIAGDERLLLLAIPAEGPAFIFGNKLYELQLQCAAENGVVDSSHFIFWNDSEDAVSLFASELRSRASRMDTIALEPSIPAFFSLPLIRAFKSSRFSLGDPLVMPLRQRKDETELAIIREACKRSDQAFKETLAAGRAWLGKTEKDFDDELCARLHKLGVESRAVVAVGENAAEPHHVADDTKIRDGAGLLIDFWGAYQGYYTDCTRTVHFGKPSDEFIDVYNVVLKAHLAAEKAVRLNLDGKRQRLCDVDSAAREVITQAGYGPYFTHRLGHGLGIEDHEGAPAAQGETTELETGMVFSDEPGIYLPGKLGVRIENTLAVTEGDAEVFHHYPRELQIL